MRRWTYKDIKDKIQRDLDIEDELFVQPEELLEAVNEGIEEAEAEIHTLGAEDKYFLTKAIIPLVAGTNVYSLPSDIYANKIRSVMVSGDSNNYYPIDRIRDLNYLGYDLRGSGPSGYILLNPSAAVGVQLMLMPTPSNSQNLMLIYLRSANRLMVDTDICDIPAFVRFVIQYAKCHVLEKEGHPNYPIAATRLEQSRQLMISTLSNMVPDENNIIQSDKAFYEDQT